MAISQEDIQQVLNAIKAESQGVQELEEVTSLNGVNSLPAVKGNELVSVPVSLLQKPATDAAAKAEEAAQTANKAAQTAEDAKNAANSAAATANESAGKANAAAAAAQEAAASYEETAKAASELGIRALLSRCILGEGDETLVKFEEAQELYDSCNNMANGRIKVCVGIHAPYTCSQEVIKKASLLAKKLDVPIHIHYLETTDEITQMKERYNKTSTEYLKETGIFDSKVILAHGVHVSKSDLEFLKTVDAGVVHNPISNQKLGSGIIDLGLYRDFAVPVGLGTDGQGSTNTLDMFEEIKSAAYLQKVTKKTATAISAYDVLKMATIDGAKVLGMDNEIGSLEVGKKADIIIIDLNKPHLCPVHDIYSTLAYSVYGSDVETVIIDGEIIMEDRELKTVDEVMVMDKVNEVVKNLF